MHCTSNLYCHSRAFLLYIACVDVAGLQPCSIPGRRWLRSAQSDTAGMRSVCSEEEETAFNHLLQCDGCRSLVHMACYGVAAPPEGRLWLCDLCRLGTLLHPSNHAVLACASAQWSSCASA